ISLGGNRVSRWKVLRNLGIVFLLTGIWHGAEWTFIVWGIWHGMFIIIEKICNLKKFEEGKHFWGVEILRHLYCILIFVIGWVIFRAENIGYAWKYIKNMFGVLPLKEEEFLYAMPYYVDRIEIVTFIVAVFCSIPILGNYLESKNVVIKGVTNVWLIVLFFLSTICIASSTYNPFIYFRF
ncbi:MAG TPA: hypothetical protein DDY68_00755, partial [Porphyromonadaceae bacterium]|nr:hypothetical protein [Porphyromonadaceae bacterium]